MKLTPGIYKIKVMDGMLGKTHYLRVFREKKHLVCQIDHGLPIDAEQYADHFELGRVEILKVLSKEPKYSNVVVTFSFMDEDGDHYEMRARNAFVIKRILHFFPGLRNALNMNQRHTVVNPENLSKKK